MLNRIRYLMFVFVSLVMLAGCSQEAPLKVSTHPWIGYESILIAQQNGDLSNNIQLRLSRSASESLERLEVGLIDAATLTLDEVLQARAQGMQLSIVAVMNISNGADSVFARQAMPNLDDLRGKRIAFEQGAVGELVLSAMLSEAGLSKQQVELIHFPINRLEGVWHNNFADVVIAYEPVASAIEASGGVRIYDSSQMPNMIFDVLAVKTSVLA